MGVRVRRYTPKEAWPLASALYERLKAEVEPGNIGKAIALDLLSNDYEIDADERAAENRLAERHPEVHIVTLKIGGGTFWQLGRGYPPKSS